MEKPLAKIELVKKLGKGASAEVYLAKLNDREVAVKIVKKKDELYREAEILRRIPQHKNLIKLLDSVSTELGTLLVFEYVNGAKDLLKYTPANDLALIDLFYQIADGVSALHSEGILHRDLKPANIMLKGTTPYIIDYGSACDLSSVSGTVACTGLVGTPNFMAPEVWSRRYSKASDVYALGVTFYMLTTKGTPPYVHDKKDPIESLKKVVTSDTPPASLISNIPRLNFLVMAMIDKRKDARPTIEGVKAALSEITKAI